MEVEDQRIPTTDEEKDKHRNCIISLLYRFSLCMNVYTWDDSFIQSVEETGLYSYRCCFTTKVKPNVDFDDKTPFEKFKYIINVILTLYSVTISIYLTIVDFEG